MDTAALLGPEEIRRLSEYLAPERQESKRYWAGWVFLMLMPLLFFALSQIEMRWLPGYWEGQGLAVCRAHATLRHGEVWVPSPPELAKLVKIAGLPLLLCSLYAGVGIWATFHHERRARQFAQMIAGSHPTVTFPNFGKRQRPV